MTISANKCSESSLGAGRGSCTVAVGRDASGERVVRAMRTECEAHPKMKTRYLLK